MTLLTDLGGALLYFTLLVPIWEQRPLVEEDIYPGSYPLDVPAEQVQFATKGFDYADQELLAAMVQSFGHSQSPVAREELFRLLKDEQPPAIVATVLIQASRLPLDDPQLESMIVPYLGHEDWRVRFWAARLYGIVAQPDPAKLLAMAKEDSSERVKMAALQAIGEHARQLSFDRIQPMLTSENMRIRRAAWAVALAARGTQAQRRIILDQAGKGDVVIRHAIAGGLALAPPELGIAIASQCAGDKHPSVRGETARQLGNLDGSNVRDLLLSLTPDPDHGVRRNAAHSLAGFPEERVVRVLGGLLSDPHMFVREEAEDSLVTIHGKRPVDETVVAVLASDDAKGRLSAYRVLGRIGVQRHRERIAQRVTSEENEENIAGALHALAELGYCESDAPVLAFLGHESEMVRAAVADALGNIDRDTVDKGLLQLVEDESREVKAAAIKSMGRLGKMTFEQKLLEILLDTGMDSRFTSYHRGSACWSAARLPKIGPALEKRLVAQSITPVIKTPDGPVFEPPATLVSASFALAQQARRNPDVSQSFHRVYAVHSKQWTDAELMTASQNSLIPSPELREFARQAKAYLAGEEIEPALRPTRKMQFIYRPLKN